MFITLGTPYTTNDLNIPSRKLKADQRSRIKILFIDDEEFMYINELRNSGFNITHYNDIPDLNAVNAFPIIISDIKGVGKAFKSPQEGAYLIRELRKTYPLKVIAAYTGQTHDIGINSYLDGVYIIKKDILVDDWCTEIDTLIKKATDPQETWKKIRDLLINEGVPLLSLVKLENEYVDRILNKHGNFHGFPSSDKKLKLSSDIRGIIQSLIAGIILS